MGSSSNGDHIFSKEHCSTGKSVSEALILEPVNPQYDKRLFIEFTEKYKFRTCCVQILVRMSKQKHNLLSYCGLTDWRMRASDTDLPVS